MAGMGNLRELVTENNRDQAVADVAQALENTVSQLSGLAGKTVQLGYAAAKKKHPQLAEKIADTMLESLCDTLDPYWQQYQDDAESDFGRYLLENKNAVADDLLELADKKVEEIDNSTLTKGHQRFRNKSLDYAEISLPALGKALEDNAK